MRVAVLGSCVTRDLFEFDVPRLLGTDIPLYISRATAASIMGQAITKEMLPAGYVIPESGFDARRFSHDLNKTQLSSLTQVEWDALLVDFVDERHATFVYEDMALTFSTHSAGLISEWLKQGVGQLLTPSKLNAYQRAIRAASSLGHYLKTVMKDRPLILHPATLATHYLHSGVPTPFPEETQKKIKLFNLYLRGVYEAFLQASQAEILSPINKQLHVAGGKHKWDLQPYHYDQGYYLDIGEQLADRLGL